LLFGRFAQRSLGKAHAGMDSDLLKHRFFGARENPAGLLLPGGRKHPVEIAGCRQYLPVNRQIFPLCLKIAGAGNPCSLALFAKKRAAFACRPHNAENQI
jgi:hypothetical protein